MAQYDIKVLQEGADGILVEKVLVGGIIHHPSFVLNGAGAAITTGSKGTLILPYSGTISNWYVVGAYGVTGSIQIDIRRSGTSIVGAGNKPIISSANTANAAVSSWASNTVSAGDILEIYVDSCSTFQYVNLILLVA
jgi:hypothetical protein